MEVNAFVTGLTGIMAVCAALFCAFGSGIEIQKVNRYKAAVALSISVGFAIVGIALLLVRS